MNDAGDRSGELAALAEFAEAHGLTFAKGGDLPREGGLLSRDSLQVLGTARGRLPGGADGTLAFLTYEYRSNDTTHTKRLTAAVVEVPESIGFAPYLAYDPMRLNLVGARVAAKHVEIIEGVKIWADEGIDPAWLRELFSPALSDWLARSPDGFSWELKNGVLAASLDGHRDRDPDLVRVCEDAGHLANAFRQESLEEVSAGSAARSAAKAKPNPETILIERLLPLVEFERPPANVIEARPAFRELVVRHPSTWFVGLFMTLVWSLLVNLIGGGIFGLLLNLPSPLIAVAVFEMLVFSIVGYLTIRREINSRSEKLAREAFWREYAKGRGLVSIDPRTFAATHAKAELPGSPLRVLAGTFDGVDDALMVTGDGLKRGDAIAIVRGPNGPVASADFNVSAPGASVAALDSYVERLAGELRA